MLTERQNIFYDMFGFLVMKNVFSLNELATIQAEFDHRAKIASSYEPFDGTKRHALMMMGDDTPFFASLLEDPRFADTAEKLYGEVIGFVADANRYVGDTIWHFDTGGLRGEGYGVKFAFYLEPVRANTGALRVIPGSHRQPWHAALSQLKPIGPRWTRLAATPAESKLAKDGIDDIPCHVCESDPGDVVAFDTRLFHASLGGSNDRHMCTVCYYKYPETQEDLEVTILNAKGAISHRDNSADPWNPPAMDADWIANRVDNAKRQRWIEQIQALGNMPLEQNGLTTVAENGKWKLMPV